MQRFSNLDKAEIQAANVNDLINDVAALLEPKYKGKVDVMIDLQPVPPLVCRPQQLSAVFSNLMGNAIDATNGNGRVWFHRDKRSKTSRLRSRTTAAGRNARELDTIFRPGV